MSIKTEGIIYPSVIHHICERQACGGISCQQAQCESALRHQGIPIKCPSVGQCVVTPQGVVLHGSSAALTPVLFPPAGMRILVTLLLDTLPMLGNVLLLCFFVFFIFGIVGVQLWAGLLRNRCFVEDNFSL